MIRKTKRKNTLIKKYSKKNNKKNIKSKKIINSIGGGLNKNEKEALIALMQLYENKNLCEILEKYYHKPLQQVAKEIGICTTVLKKICRSCGIKRWPFRSITSKKVRKEEKLLKEEKLFKEGIQDLTQALKNQKSNSESNNN